LTTTVYESFPPGFAAGAFPTGFLAGSGCCDKAVVVHTSTAKTANALRLIWDNTKTDLITNVVET